MQPVTIAKDTLTAANICKVLFLCVVAFPLENRVLDALFGCVN